jgi:hypothetical protein
MSCRIRKSPPLNACRWERSCRAWPAPARCYARPGRSRKRLRRHTSSKEDLNYIERFYERLADLNSKTQLRGHGPSIKHMEHITQRFGFWRKRSLSRARRRHSAVGLHIAAHICREFFRPIRNSVAEAVHQGAAGTFVYAVEPGGELPRKINCGVLTAKRDSNERIRGARARVCDAVDQPRLSARTVSILSTGISHHRVPDRSQQIAGGGARTA